MLAIFIFIFLLTTKSYEKGPARRESRIFLNILPVCDFSLSLSCKFCTFHFIKFNGNPLENMGVRASNIENRKENLCDFSLIFAIIKFVLIFPGRIRPSSLRCLEGVLGCWKAKRGLWAEMCVQDVRWFLIFTAALARTYRTHSQALSQKAKQKIEIM